MASLSPLSRSKKKAVALRTPLRSGDDTKTSSNVEKVLRVLHMIDTGGPGGAETVLALIVTHLPKQSYHSRVLVPSEGWLSDSLREAGVDTVVLRNRPVSRLSYLIALRREIDRYSPDVIHAHLFGAAVYASLATRGWGFHRTAPPVISTFHGRPDVRSDDPFLAVKARVIPRYSNRLVYVSRDLRSHLEPLLGASQLARVIHNGVPESIPCIAGDRRRDCGARSTDILVGAVGNLRRAKDYPTFLRAMRLVRESRSDVRFVIVGAGSEEQRKCLEDLATELGVADILRLVGFQEDAATWVNALDLFVSSSYTEGLPLATIEAMSLGKPVVATRCGGVPELIESGIHGLLVPPGDPEALSEGILNALSDPERAAAWGRSARLRAHTEFGVQRMVNSYRELYESVLGSGASQRSSRDRFGGH